jgi:hypothetical protein
MPADVEALHVERNMVVGVSYLDIEDVANKKSLTLKRELSPVLSKHGFDVQNM